MQLPREWFVDASTMLLRLAITVRSFSSTSNESRSQI